MSFLRFLSLCTSAFLLVNCGREDTAAQEDQLLSTDFVGWVNPLMGTDSKFELSNGNTYPAIALPWGMHFWTPMTAPMGDGWTYQYDHHKIRGFKQTHQPSPWLNDYGAFSLMAVTGKQRFRESERASWFSHKSETARPDYYQVYLADYDTQVEFTPTERAAHFRFTFPRNDSSYILLDAFDGGSRVEVHPEQRRITGYARNHHGGVPGNFHNYFVAEFDTDFEEIDVWKEDELLKDAATAKGNHVGAILRFSTKKGQQVHVKVASSFIGPEQALLNLQREIGEASFADTRARAAEVWNRELGRIRVSSRNQDDLATFYSCLYRVLLFPRKFYEEDASGQIVHYSPYNGNIEPGYMFTDNGFWDTFRAVFPFFNLMYPERTRQIMKGLANTYKESGWLPEWASPGHRNAMIGSNSAPIVADAYLQGHMDEEDAPLLLEALLKNATVEEGRPVASVGREGLSYYNALGYIPYDVGIRENAARSLEYAFADFAIAKMAEKMGRDSIAAHFRGQSLNYRHLYDAASGWMRGKNEDGRFQEPFNPLKWGDAFTEGNSIHYTWSVFHDIEGLIGLMGGDEAFVSKLDTVFGMPPEFDASYYGFPIHEIREMQIAHMGNYAHGNQPIQHMLYLYAYAGAPWKGEQRIREVLSRLYHPGPDGYCGDEDNGQTSAWYVFSALGFYPAMPVGGQFVLGSPLFDRVEIHFENGRTLDIHAESNGPKRPYVQSVTLNGSPYEPLWIDTETLRKGGLLRFEMGASPNTERGREKQLAPFSLSASRER